MREFLGRWKAAMAVLAVPVLAGVWYLASPLFLSTTVNEEFPPAAAASAPAAAGSTGMQVSVSPAAGSSQMADGGATMLSGGSFRDGDSFHRGSGQATVYRLADGSLTLRLEDFQVTNGPDLYVVLSPEANPTTSGQVMAPGYTEVARLKGDVGNQNYTLPANIDPSSLRSVVIYCRAFHVIFSVASLQADE